MRLEKITRRAKYVPQTEEGDDQRGYRVLEAEHLSLLL